MKNCPNCNSQISDTAKFCKYCGNKIEEKKQELFCEECGAKIDADAPFCEECGAKVGGDIQEDPWAEIEPADPWAQFADYKEPETIVVEKPVEVVVERVVEKSVQIEKPVPQQSDELQGAINAFNRGDHATAASVFEKLANQGDAKAQYWFGFCHLKGKGVKKSMAKARDWLTKSAQQNYLEAKVQLANFYAFVYNTAADKQEKAAFWFESAAEQGGVAYQAEAARYYRWHYKNKAEKAIYWYERAANQGHVPSMDELSFIYYNEFSLGKQFVDFSKARQWNEKAMSHNSGEAYYIRSDWYNFGSCGCPRDKQKARELLQKSAELGYIPAKKALENK